ncbi:Angiogenic factor with G patch and FHA domains 1 [Gryganskiella cystojenkinii]|nr:Angiogenic factor with G patch and FHA domains 1 [Gryganskiella cystojenkinii]
MVVQEQQQQHQQQQQLQQEKEQHGYYTDPATGYQVDRTDQRQTLVEEPPESDATLRLCVLSSEILPIGGVILMDASGLSFGRDRPLSGQGKRVRMVEMGVSRFHASIYLDRQYYTPEQPQQHTHWNDPSVQSASAESFSRSPCEAGDESGTPSSTEGTPVSSSVGTFGAINLNGGDNASSESTPRPETDDNKDIASPKSGSQFETINPVASTSTPVEGDDDHEEGEIEDSSSAGATSPFLPDQVRSDDRPEESYEDEQKRKKKEKEDREYQEELQRQYHQYYENLAAAQQPSVLIDTFQIVDAGSTHGTLLNGQRLSAAKTASQPHPLKHMDQLQLGTTVIEIHAHEDGRICARCQITDTNEIEVLDDKDNGGGAEQKAATAAALLASKNAAALGLDQKLSREQERIEEMNRLRKKWAGPEKKSIVTAASGAKRSGNGSMAGKEGSSSSAAYVDRAAKRRLYNPDHSAPVPSVAFPVAEELPETAAGFHIPVAKTNKGHAMLSKMGWKAGTGLGASGQGVVEPVQLMVAEKKAGLGSGSLQTQGAAAAASGSSPSSSTSRVKETAAEIARRKARERYARLK